MLNQSPNNAASEAPPVAVPAKKGKTSATVKARVASATAKLALPAPPQRAPKAKKAALPTKPVPKAAAKPAGKPAVKLVRDSFTMPQREFGLIAELKDRALDFKRPTKKSELLRAGLKALAAMNSDALKAALDQLAPIKTGRPKKHA